ncbi:MAG: prepilin-type N-terminal cleavage/methylation domain-containing protein, partial [Planctomycetota bacterium]|nr:prepilin-type N-terminal cleavage/methylation domain-containing protein [Planctomycetota bacterium]
MHARHTRPLRRGLTLIEVMVVVGVIALLMGMLTPALMKGRGGARTASCAQTQRDLHTESMAWSVSHREEIPGVNTSNHRYTTGGPHALLQMLGDTTSETPTQTYDWISPVVGASRTLPVNRARRTKHIFEELGCAAATAQNEATWGTSPDRDDFINLLKVEGIAQISYLAPAPFHLLGPIIPTQGPKGEHFKWRGPAVPPRHYTPRIDRVGAQLSHKIFLADGTRYLPPSGVLDFDVTP